MITAHTTGTATITAAASSGVTAQCVVTVRELHQLALPERLKRIEDEAFQQTAADFVRIPDGCTHIGSKAFASSTQLLSVYMPDSILSIADDAFEGCIQVTFLCESQNASAEYAAAHEIPFRIEQGTEEAPI